MGSGTTGGSPAATTGTIGSTTNAASGMPVVGTSPNAYSQVAPLTAQQTQAMANVSNLAQPVQNQLNTAANTNNWMTTGALMSPNSNPYLSAMYNAAAQPTVANYVQSVAPNILQQGAQTGTLGSAGYGQAFNNAQSSLAEGLGNLGANLYGNAYNTGLQATQNAIAQAPATATSLYTPTNALFSSGLTGQNQAQQILDTTTTNLNAQANWPFQAMNILGQGLNTASGGGGSTVTVGTSPSTAGGK